MDSKSTTPLRYFIDIIRHVNTDGTATSTAAAVWCCPRTVCALNHQILLSSIQADVEKSHTERPIIFSRSVSPFGQQLTLIDSILSFQKTASLATLVEKISWNEGEFKINRCKAFHFGLGQASVQKCTSTSTQTCIFQIVGVEKRIPQNIKDFTAFTADLAKGNKLWDRGSEYILSG